MKKITCRAKKKQPKIKTEMTGKGLTVHGGLLPVLTFMEKLHFYKAVETALHKQRGANARYQFADAVQMVVIGVMTGACAMTQVAAVWADDVLKRMAGYKEVPVDTSLGRIIKKVSFSDVASMEGLNHSFRNRIWKHAVRSGLYLKSALSVIWLDVDIKVKLKNLNALLEKQEWKVIDAKRLPGWEQTEFEYKCSNWRKPRKFKAVRQLIGIEKGLIELREYQYFCYVTTEDLAPYAAHKKYGERATCETWIEECKTQMNAGHIRTSEFWANSILFQCAILAYNLLKWMALLTGGAVRQWEIKTMRLWLIRVAGKLAGGSRQLILKLPEEFLHQEEWRAWEQMANEIVI